MSRLRSQMKPMREAEIPGGFVRMQGPPPMTASQVANRALIAGGGLAAMQAVNNKVATDQMREAQAREAIDNELASLRSPGAMPAMRAYPDFPIGLSQPVSTDVPIEALPGIPQMAGTGGMPSPLNLSGVSAFDQVREPSADNIVALAGATRPQATAGGSPESYLAPALGVNPLQPRPLLDGASRAAMDIREAVDAMRRPVQGAEGPWSPNAIAMRDKSMAHGPGFTPQASDEMLAELAKGYSDRMGRMGMSPNGQPVLMPVGQGTFTDFDAMRRAQAEKDATANAAKRTEGNANLKAFNAMSPGEAAAMISSPDFNSLPLQTQVMYRTVAKRGQQGPPAMSEPVMAALQNAAGNVFASFKPTANARPDANTQLAQMAPAFNQAKAPVAGPRASGADLAAAARAAQRRYTIATRDGGVPPAVAAQTYGQMSNLPIFQQLMANAGGGAMNPLAAGYLGGPEMARIVSGANIASLQNQTDNRKLDILAEGQKATNTSRDAELELRRTIEKNNNDIKQAQLALQREGMTNEDRRAAQARLDDLAKQQAELANRLAITDKNNATTEKVGLANAESRDKTPDQLKAVNEQFSQLEKEKADWGKSGRVGPLLQSELEQTTPKMNVWSAWPDRLLTQSAYNSALAQKIAGAYGITVPQAMDWVQKNADRLSLGRSW